MISKSLIKSELLLKVNNDIILIFIFRSTANREWSWIIFESS